MFGLVLGMALLSCDQPPPATPETAAIVPTQDPAKCDKAVALAVQYRVIRDRPTANRIDVDDALWAQAPAKTKRLTLAAALCSALRGRASMNGDFVAAYGYRSGKRLAMITNAGVTFD